MNFPIYFVYENADATFPRTKLEFQEIFIVERDPIGFGDKLKYSQCLLSDMFLLVF